MLVIASNVTTRDSNVNYLFRQAKKAAWSLTDPSARGLGDLALRCSAAAGGIEINLQQRFGQPEAMAFAVKAIQRATDVQLCLSANDVPTIEAGLKVCKHPPIVNYVSFEGERLRELLPLAARYKATVVLMVSNAAAPADAREMLQKAAILIGAANEAGISSDHILVDPGLIHLSSDVGQRHLVEVADFLHNLPEATDPPAASTCWLGNISAGSPRRLRPDIESALLPFLAGAGLSSVFMDVLRRDNLRALRLVQMFSNTRVYADTEVEL